MSAPEPHGEGLEALLHYIGLEDIRPQGDEILARCPDHPHWEQRPRHWSINVRTGWHHCFSCEYGGSLIKLVMDQTKLGLWDATRLINGHRIDFDRSQADDDFITGDDYLDYVREMRKLFDDYFRPFDQWVGMVDKYLTPRGLSIESCRVYEVRCNDEADRPGWVLPLKNPDDGNLIGWRCKPFDPEKQPWIEPKGVKKSECLFGYDRLDTTRVILVESELDVAYLHSNGFGFSAVATYGCNVSDAQLALLADSYVLGIVLALDNDEAGAKGTQSILDRGFHRRVPTYLFHYGDATGKDPGELSRPEIERGLAQAQLVPRRKR